MDLWILHSQSEWKERVLMTFRDADSLLWQQASTESELHQRIYAISLRFACKTAKFEFRFDSQLFAFPSSHPEVAKAAVHSSTGPQLPHTGAAADRVAGARALRVFCGRFSKKETQQKLLHPRGHLPVPQGKSMSNHDRDKCQASAQELQITSLEHHAFRKHFKHPPYLAGVLRSLYRPEKTHWSPYVLPQRKPGQIRHMLRNMLGQETNMDIS